METSILCNNESMTMPMYITDGGRIQAGYRGYTHGDCVTRAVAIAAGLPYQEAYDLVNRIIGEDVDGDRSSARTGVAKELTRKVFESLGFTWVPTMKIGSGCTVHLRADELPSGTIVANLSKHVAAVIDGVLYDSHDSSRDGTRCVYGYWTRT